MPSSSRGRPRPRRSRRVLNRFETWLSRSLGDIHPCVFNEPEEDFLLAVHSFATGFVYLCIPFIASMRQRGHHVIFIDTLPVTQRVRYLRFYESLVNVISTSRQAAGACLSTVLITALHFHIAQFPDAKFIALARRSHECLPSMMSLTHTIWQKYEARHRKRFGGDARMLSYRQARPTPIGGCYGQLAPGTSEGDPV